jgi:hypothetical protein
MGATASMAIPSGIAVRWLAYETHHWRRRKEGKKKKKEERISWTIRIRSDLQREDEGTKTDLLERAIDAEAVVLGLRAVGLEEEGEVRKSAFQARDASNEEGEMSN